MTREDALHEAVFEATSYTEQKASMQHHFGQTGRRKAASVIFRDFTGNHPPLGYIPIGQKKGGVVCV